MQPDSTAMVQPPVSLEEETLNELERLVGREAYNHWFRSHAAIEIGARRVTIAVKNPFLLTWMQHRFRPAVAEATRRTLGEGAEVQFCAPPSRPVAAQSAENLTATLPSGTTDAVRRHAAEQDVLTAPAPLAETKSPPTPCLLRLGRGIAHVGAAAQAVRASVAGPAALQSVPHQMAYKSRKPAPPAAMERSRRDADDRTRPSPAAPRRLGDLADLVKGPGNELALTAALQICDQPGTRYNPLVLYGGVGIGKTHLLEGIHRRLRASHPSLRGLLLSAETFANCFTQALRDRSLPSFRQRFRSLDVLLVDDVDFLDGKRVIQEEFLHTIEQLESHQRQIVLTADRHPRLLTRLSEELVTRFLSGIVCRIEPPCLQTRREILARKAQRLPRPISTDVLEFIAQRFTTSVRELEGAINCLETYALMSGKDITLSIARHVLSDLHRDCLRVIRLSDVQNAVCKAFGVEAEVLRSSRRSRSVSQPRMLAMYLARKLTQSAYSEIGEYFGGRNHSTVMSAEKRVRDLLAQQATVQVVSQSWKLADLMSSLEQQLLCG